VHTDGKEFFPCSSPEDRKSLIAAVSSATRATPVGVGRRETVHVVALLDLDGLVGKRLVCGLPSQGIPCGCRCRRSKPLELGHVLPFVHFIYSSPSELKLPCSQSRLRRKKRCQLPMQCILARLAFLSLAPRCKCCGIGAQPRSRLSGCGGVVERGGPTALHPCNLFAVFRGRLWGRRRDGEMAPG
jgi:hypothetical protein